MFPAGLEPATFRVWGGRDNHYTTETALVELWTFKDFMSLHSLYAVLSVYFLFFFSFYLASCVDLILKVTPFENKTETNSQLQST